MNDQNRSRQDAFPSFRALTVLWIAAAVILLTGHGSQTAAKEGLLAGAFDFLTKPCELVELMEKIREAHEHHQKHSENINLLDKD